MMKEELKKIWKFRMVVILIFLGFLFYTMFLEFYIKYFPNGPYAIGVFQVGKKVVEEYGTSLSFEEMEEVKAGLPKLYQEADRCIQELELAKKHGLDSYQAYMEFKEASLEAIVEIGVVDERSDYADAMRIQNYLTSEETENIDGRIRGVEDILEQYEAEQMVAEVCRIVEGEGLQGSNLNENKDSRLCYDVEKQYSKKEFEHIQKTFYNEADNWRNVLPNEVVETTGLYLSYLLIWICLSICILLSPLLVYDRMSRMNAIQYSSKRGRKLLILQFKAVLLSAFLLTTLNLILFGGIFLTNGTKAFFSCRMYSFEGEAYCWANWTHGTWCMVLIGLIYFVAIGTAGIIFFLSKYSTNYIGILLKLVPLFVGIAILCHKLLYQAFYYNNALYQITKIPYIEMITAAAILLIGVRLCTSRHFLQAGNFE